MAYRKHLHSWPLALVLIAGMAGYSISVWSSSSSAQQAPPAGHMAEAAPLNSADLAGAENLSRAFRAAAKRVIPTVVKIKTTTEPRSVQNGGGPARENPFKGTPYEDFFGDFFEDGRGMLRGAPRRQGLGSGVIIDPKGLVLTNNHVVEGADDVVVELSDGRQLKASNIKTDPESDLAVFQIEAGSPLPAAMLGNSDEMEIGDWVLAIGNPFELELTVSAGIISGKGRALTAGQRASYLQTDAAINPGNSGGPLVNLRGEVVGVNTAIASNTGAYQGVGFAIPINLAKWVSSQLAERGMVERAYLGVGIAELDAKVAERLGVDRRAGVLVTEVFSDTPAEKAGFQIGDLIVAFAGHPVANPRELQALVERSPSGSKQNVTVLRDGKSTTLYVVVRTLPRDFAAAPGRSDEAPDDSPSGFRAEQLGFDVVDMTPGIAQKLGLDDVQGVVVSKVAPTSIAAGAGIREGMVILRVGKKAVGSVAEFEAALQGESLAKGVLLLVRSGNGNRFIVLQKS